MDELGFPRTAEQVTGPWLSQVLERAGLLGGGRLVSHAVERVGDPGQTGDVVKLLLRCEDAPLAPSSVVAKFAAPFESARAHMHALGLYEREVFFYRDFGADPGISIPTCYFADIDRATGDFVIVLEDMSVCRLGDFWVPTLAHVEIAIDHLAGLHARWWNSPRLREIPWLRQPDDRAYFSGALGPLLPALLPLVEQRFGERFPRYLRDLTVSMCEQWEEYWPEREGDERTLVHADFHPKQLFFPTASGGRFAAFDWQSVMVGAGALDLQRILLLGLTPAQLREHGARLLARYQQRLAESGITVTADHLLAQVRRVMPLTLYITVLALATTDPAILERAAAARGVDYLGRVFGDLEASLRLYDVHEVFRMPG